MENLVLRIVSRLLFEPNTVSAQLLTPSIHIFCYEGYDDSLSGAFRIPLAKTEVGLTGYLEYPSRTLIQHDR
jgi:hypothetical protein